MSGKKGMKAYPKEIKKEAIRLYLKEGWSTQDIDKELGIRDPNRIFNWLIGYRKEGEKFFEKKPRGRKKGSVRILVSSPNNS
jgi:transposase-like protein